MTDIRKGMTDMIDMSYLIELSGGDAGYIGDVLGIFLETIPQGIEKLNTMAAQADVAEQMSRLAHSMKSSLTIVKVRGMYEKLNSIERLTLMGQATSPVDMIAAVEEIKAVSALYAEAHPVIVRMHDAKKAT